MALAQVAQSTFYVPFDVAESRNDMTLVVRSELPTDQVAPLIRRTVWAVDADLPVEDITTASALVANSTRDERFRSVLLVAFALAATILCATGLFGVTTRIVTFRRRELGIRLALGARPRELVRRVALEESGALLVGLFAGGVGAALVGSTLASFLFGVSPRDPLSFGVAVAVLVVTCGVATWLAAWRGTLLDPVDAIRAE